MQEGTLSQTFLDVFESDDLVSQLAEQADYRHYPIPNQKSLHQRPPHEGHNFLSGKATAIQQARERKEHAKNEMKNKKGRTNNDNSIAHTSDLGSKARSSKPRYKKQAREYLASEETKNKTNKPKKKDEDTKQNLNKTNKPKNKDDDKKQLERNRDNFMKSLYGRKKDSTLSKPPVPANKESVQVEKKACTPRDKKKPIVKTTPIEKKTPIQKKKVSFDDAINSAVMSPCGVIVPKLPPQKLPPQKLPPQKLQLQKQNFKIPKVGNIEPNTASSSKDTWRLGTLSTPTPKPEHLLESPGTSSSDSTTDKKDLKSCTESLKIMCESEQFDPNLLKNIKKETVEEVEQSEIEQIRKKYDKVLLMDKYKQKKRKNNT